MVVRSPEVPLPPDQANSTDADPTAVNGNRDGSGAIGTENVTEVPPPGPTGFARLRAWGPAKWTVAVVMVVLFSTLPPVGDSL